MKYNFLSRTDISEDIPSEMLDVITDLKQSSSKEECLQKAYEVMTQKYRGYKLRTYVNFLQIFVFDSKKLWDKSGFIHCHNANHLMRILLVKSGFFENKDIENKWTTVLGISLHQYLQVTLDDNHTLDIDIWGAVYGIKFGDYAHGFH